MPDPAGPAKNSIEPAPGNRLALWTGGVALLVIATVVISAVLVAGGFRGRGAATTQVPAATPATLPASAVASGPLPDVAGQARACRALPAGTPAGFLGITAAASGIAVDPSTGLATPFVAVSLNAAAPAASPAYSVIVTILPFGASPAPVSQAAIDHLGTALLIAYWDGARWHRGLRTWSGTTWVTTTDVSAAGVDVLTVGATVTLFWQGLSPGAKFGEVAADGRGCTAHDLGLSLTPTGTYTG